ncbi:hypothetical protein SPB21_27680 [Leptothoe sp. ISB3NOV94-8A]
MTDLASVDATIGKATYRFKGAKWFYSTKAIRDNIGATLTGEGDLADNVVIDKKVSYQRVLVRMVAQLAPDSVVGGNAAQENRSRQYRFWCHPEFVREALVNLPGKTVDESLLPGNYKIRKVFMPVDSNLA